MEALTAISSSVIQQIVANVFKWNFKNNTFKVEMNIGYGLKVKVEQALGQHEPTINVLYNDIKLMSFNETGVKNSIATPNVVVPIQNGYNAFTDQNEFYKYESTWDDKYEKIAEDNFKKNYLQYKNVIEYDDKFNTRVQTEDFIKETNNLKEFLFPQINKNNYPKHYGQSIISKSKSNSTRVQDYKHRRISF